MLKMGCQAANRKRAPAGEALVAGEHVPDRLGELAREIDLGDLGTALATQPALDRLIALGKDGMVVGAERRFHRSPAQVLGPMLGQRPARVGVARLLDARAQAAAAHQLDRGREAVDVADLRRDRVAVDLADPRRGHQQRHVGMISAGALEPPEDLIDPSVQIVDQLKGWP
jgi:hypothetical protein